MLKHKKKDRLSSKSLNSGDQSAGMSQGASTGNNSANNDSQSSLSEIGATSESTENSSQRKSESRESKHDPNERKSSSDTEKSSDTYTTSQNKKFTRKSGVLIPKLVKSEKAVLNPRIMMKTESIGTGSIKCLEPEADTQMIRVSENFIVENVEDCIISGKEFNLILQKRVDIYQMKCYPNVHKNYVAYKYAEKEFVILSMMKDGDRHICFETGTKGCFQIESSLQNKNKFDKLVDLNYDCLKIVQPEFKEDILTVEQRHKYAVEAMQIAVLLSLDNEYDPHKMMKLVQSSHTPEFKKFLELFNMNVDESKPPLVRGTCSSVPSDFIDSDPSAVQTSTSTKKIKSQELSDIFQTKTQPINITFFLSTILDEEDQRQYIGNTICFIIFRDLVKQTQFDQTFETMDMHGLGKIPHFFMVIEPHGEDQYKIGCFKKKALPFFFPLLNGIVVGKDQLRDIVYTKAYNGFFTTMSCPPMDRLMQTLPREATLHSIIQKASPQFFKKY